MRQVTVQTNSTFFGIAAAKNLSDKSNNKNWDFHFQKLKEISEKM